MLVLFADSLAICFSYIELCSYYYGFYFVGEYGHFLGKNVKMSKDGYDETMLF